MKWYEFAPIAWVRDFLNSSPRAEGFLQTIGLPAEAVIKKTLFGCQSCGQCLLHENALTCPMRCPKTSRNGPCGGVRANGHCEVDAAIRCVWVDAIAGSARMRGGGKVHVVQFAVDRRLAGRSSWLAVARERHAPDVGSEGRGRPARSQ